MYEKSISSPKRSGIDNGTTLAGMDLRSEGMGRIKDIDPMLWEDLSPKTNTELEGSI